MHPSSPAFKKARRQYLKAARNNHVNVDKSWTPFRAAEKRYKARFPPPDLSNVLDLAMLDSDSSRSEELRLWHGSSDAVEWVKLPVNQSGDGNANLNALRGQAFIVPRIPGLVLLPSFLSAHEQLRLVRWSLEDQARHPNMTNLDTHYALPKNGIWDAFIHARKDCNDDLLIQRHPSTFVEVDPETTGPRKLIENRPANLLNFHALSSTPKPPPAPSSTVPPLPSSALMYKLRWANIGWYYHWDSKQYDFTRGKEDVPEELRNLCKRSVEMVDWQSIFGDQVEKDETWHGDDWKTWNESYGEPDAGIVNFYQANDTLMGHVDRSEICATSPLVSISLGNAAIFLIGGLTRDVEPVPILLRSGDVVIMSGPACRRAYHGVPRILENTLPLHFHAMKETPVPDWKYFEEFLRTTRINVNVRQVFPKGFMPDLVAANYGLL